VYGTERLCDEAIVCGSPGGEKAVGRGRKVVYASSFLVRYS
jgi:hypothetical protein